MKENIFQGRFQDESRGDLTYMLPCNRGWWRKWVWLAIMLAVLVTVAKSEDEELIKIGKNATMPTPTEVDIFSDQDRYQLEKLKSAYFKLSGDAVTAQLLSERKQGEMNGFVEGLKGKCLQSEGRIAEVEGDLKCMARVQSEEIEEIETEESK